MPKKRKKRLKHSKYYTSERYNTRSLHEEREYGLYWYAWIWKVVRSVLIFLCSALVVIGMVSFGYHKAYDMLLAPVNPESAGTVEFEVESGQSIASIGSSLKEANLIKNSSVFKYLVQLEGRTGMISYGKYKLSPGMDVQQIVQELTGTTQTLERVITIVPGWTCEDIADYLVRLGILENRDAFLTLCKDTDRFIGASYALRDAQEHDRLNGRRYALEGCLAPDTYRIFASATPESIIRTLLAQNNTVIDREIYADNTLYYSDEEGVYHEVERYHSELSIEQTLTLASIIEKEAGNALDYARVSAVFHNRLNRGMKLQSDATINYITGAHKLLLSSEELALNSPYNTYMIDGLPAGPICCPSTAAIQAALQPDMAYINEGYLYFCAGDPETGMLVYARTEEEHQTNVEKYRPLWALFDAQH